MPSQSYSTFENKADKMCVECGTGARYKSYRKCYECLKKRFNKLQREYYNRHKEKIREKIRNKLVGKDRTCVQCKTNYKTYEKTQMFCSKECSNIFVVKNKLKKGAKCSSWKGGLYLGKNKKIYRSYEHDKACHNYRVQFLKKNDYIFCELCGTSSALRFEAHHIVYASEKPKHKELHNPQNLILLCIKCHNKLHAKKHLRNDLYEERKLKQLFS